MSRVKRGTTSLKHRKNILRKAKGYRFGRSKKERQAKEALLHAGVYAFAHRRKKKGDFRQLWQIKINAAVREHGISYSMFIDKLHKKGLGLNRKMLAELAEHNPDTFGEIVRQVSA
ncbi:MAG: 50S ribosomal protein L20 [Parcubacteria group bacterium]|nr:50S ribosomal protein L20 [Parcubacteria group bacterium]